MCGLPRASRRRKPSSRFLDQNLPMLILADVGNVAGARASGSTKWIEDGGVLVRFAGPRLAGADDDLVPVRLRRGGRTLGGALTWDKPQQLAAFSRESPFGGMPVPDDVTVNAAGAGGAGRRARRAHLGDARRRHAAGHRRAPRQGHDRAVPCHRRYPLVGPAAVRRFRRDAASASSRLPARRTAADSARRRHDRARVPPTRMLDGFGAFTAPPRRRGRSRPTITGARHADHPPGFYGPPEGLARREYAGAADRPAPVDYSPASMRACDVYRDERAARSARPGLAGARWGCCCSTPLSCCSWPAAIAPRCVPPPARR